MAKFSAELPKDLLEQLQTLEKGEMFDKMVQAGADVVYQNINNNIDKVFEDTTNLKRCLIKSRTYHAKTDDSINTKVAFYGYFKNKQGKEVPAPLVVQAREYGTTRGELKRPFIRPAFNKSQITKAMLNIQKEYIPDDQ